MVEEGSSAVLSCSYSLAHTEYVDSVKWFLNTTEVYRIVPGLRDHRYTKKLVRRGKTGLMKTYSKNNFFFFI